MPFFLGSSIGASLPTAYIQTTKGKSETTSIANHAVILVSRDDTEFLGRATTPHGTLRTCLVSQLVCSCTLVYIQTLVVCFVPLRYVHLFIHSFRHCIFCSFRSLVHFFFRTFDHASVPLVRLPLHSLHFLDHAFHLCIFCSHVGSLVRSVLLFVRSFMPQRSAFALLYRARAVLAGAF